MLFAEVDKNNCKASSLILCVLQNYEHLDVTVTDWGAIVETVLFIPGQ